MPRPLAGGAGIPGGLTRSYASDVERGQRNPTIEVVGRIAAALSISAAILVEGIPELLGRDDT